MLQFRLSRTHTHTYTKLCFQSKLKPLIYVNWLYSILTLLFSYFFFFRKCYFFPKFRIDIFFTLFLVEPPALYITTIKSKLSMRIVFFFFFLFYWWATLEPLYCGDHHQTNTPMAFSAALILHHVIYSLFLGLTMCDTGGTVLEGRWAMAGSPCPIRERETAELPNPPCPGTPSPGVCQSLQERTVISPLENHHSGTIPSSALRCKCL